MKLCGGNTWTSTSTFIYIENVTTENLIWLVVFYFSVHGDRQSNNIFLQHWPGLANPDVAPSMSIKLGSEYESTHMVLEAC